MNDRTKHVLFWSFLCTWLAGVVTVAAATGAAASDLLATHVAQWRGGNLTAEDIALYSQAARYPYADPVETALHGSIEAERKDAATFVEQIARERSWEEAMAARARDLCPNLETTVSAISRPLLWPCVIAAWQTQVATHFTTPTLAEIVEAGFRHRKAFEREEMRDVRYIFRSTTGTKTQAEREAVKKEMEEIYRLLAEHRLRFDDAARFYSQAPSSTKGGRIGTISRHVPYNRKFVDFAFSLPEDVISSPTLLHNGYYIVWVAHVYPEQRLTTETIERDPNLQKNIIALMRAEQLNEEAQKLVAKHFGPTTVTQELLAGAILEEMTTPTHCEKKERFFRERVLARTCFLDTNLERFRPTEDDARAYYTTYSKAMRKGGYLKYTRFLVPYGTVRYPTRHTALDALNKLRDFALAHPEASLEQLRAEATELGGEVTQQADWAMSSDEPKADDELVKITTGSLTNNLPTESGVAFYRLDARREQPQLSFDEVRDMCLEQARNRKAWEALQKAIDDFAREHELRILIPLPK
jgi:hypothetical protein